jgi:hypothetical protein
VFRSEYLPILQHASNLVRCELNILHGLDDLTGPQEIKLPSVELLILEDGNGDWQAAKVVKCFHTITQMEDLGMLLQTEYPYYQTS